MVKKTVLIVAVVCGMMYAGVSSNASEKPEWAPDISGGVAFATKYVWRGQLMVDDPVMQPEASLSSHGLTLSYWGNYSTADSQDRWTEHDYTIDYSFQLSDVARLFGNESEGQDYLDNLGVSLGHIFYVFPEASGKNFHSEEFYIGMSYDGLLEPSVAYYMDYGRGAGSYWTFGLGHTFSFENGMDMSLGATAAYNAGQWGYGYKFAPLLLSCEVNVPLFEYFTVTPNVYYSIALDREEDDGAGYTNEFFGGVKVSIAY